MCFALVVAFLKIWAFERMGHHTASYVRPGAKTRLDQKSTQGALADGPALAGCHAGIRPHSQRHQLQCHHQLLFTRTAYPENLIPLVQGILRVPCIHVVYTLGL